MELEVVLAVSMFVCAVLALLAGAHRERRQGTELGLALVLLMMEASSLPVASAMTARTPRSLVASSGEPTNRMDQPFG